MIFIRTGLSNYFEIIIGDTAQPVVYAGFSRLAGGHFWIVNNLIRGNNTHGPTRKTPGDAIVVVYLIGKEFPLATENPISSATVLDSERLVEPSFAHENVNKPLQDFRWFFFYRISRRSVSRFHDAPSSSVQQKIFWRPIFNTCHKMTPS